MLENKIKHNNLGMFDDRDGNSVPIFGDQRIEPLRDCNGIEESLLVSAIYPVACYFRNNVSVVAGEKRAKDAGERMKEPEKGEDCYEKH